MIELKHIKKYYTMGSNVVKALDDINLTINDGEFVTIIGPSGSGKSTMMNIIGCLDKATSGNYYVDGIEISKYSENQLAFLRNKKMGFIFQGFNLLQNLSAYENVELPLIYQGISRSERKRRVTKSLEMVDMTSRMKHRPSELSGGQQQRVAIARALATKPMCILADEPTGNLDSSTGDEIMKILKDLNDSGTTIIIITHNDEISKLSRRVVRIHDGKIDSDVINENIKSYGEFVDTYEKTTESDTENFETASQISIENLTSQNDVSISNENFVDNYFSEIMKEKVEIAKANENIVEAVKVEENKPKRGRKPKASTENLEQISASQVELPVVEEVIPKKRGRKPKALATENQLPFDEDLTKETISAKSEEIVAQKSESKKKLIATKTENENGKNIAKVETESVGEGEKKTVVTKREPKTNVEEPAKKIKIRSKKTINDKEEK